MSGLHVISSVSAAHLNTGLDTMLGTLQYLGKGYDVEYNDPRGQHRLSQFREEDVRPLR